MIGILCTAAFAALPQQVWQHAKHVTAPEADAREYQIHLVVDPSKKHAEVVVDYWFVAQAELHEVRLHSVSSERWEVNVTDVADNPLSTRAEGEDFFVKLPQAVEPGADIRFRAVCKGLPPDGLFFDKTRHKQPVVFSDNFPDQARGWFPCEDHPTDRAHFELRVDVPDGFEVVTSGQGSWLPVIPGGGAAAGQPPAGWRRWQAKTQSEIPTYMLAVAVAPYRRIEEKGDNRFIAHFIYGKDAPRARRGLKYHAAWMKTMEETFGPYAYSKYCVVQVPTRWGGMEYPGNTWIAESLFDPPGFGVSILAHEFVHQWFGDAVGYADWQDSWLSEGFASYFGPWLHATTGGPPLARSMHGLRRRWLRAEAAKKYPIRWLEYDEPVDQFSVNYVNTYPKGAWVLHMLRVHMGDESFFAGLKKYYSDHFETGVATRDLQRAMETAAGGEDLEWFFDQWLNRIDCPHLSFQWEADAVVVKQVQEGEAYRLKLPLQWTDVDGNKVKEYFEIQAKETRLELRGGPVRTPVVDPDVELLFRKI